MSSRIRRLRLIVGFAKTRLEHLQDRYGKKHPRAKSAGKLLCRLQDELEFCVKFTCGHCV